MLSSTLVLSIIVVILALTFDFINGFHDTANAIATSVSTKVLTMREAIIMSAALNFVGALISVKVAKTIGSDMLKVDHMSQYVVVAGLIAAIIWDLITWYYGIPSSSSHALIGGLIGAAIVFQGSFLVVNWTNLFDKVVIPLITSPLLGFVIGYLLMKLINYVFRSTKPSTVTKVFSKAQIASAALMAFNHGSNDAQKSMGVITLALLTAGFIPTFTVPLWVKLSCAAAMALGTSAGGRRIIKTVGVKMARLAPVNGFAAETSAAAIIFTATMLKAPVSTTHIISTSIMGVAGAKRMSSVRWVVAKNIVWAWVITIPLSGVIAGLVMYLIKLFA